MTRKDYILLAEALRVQFHRSALEHNQPMQDGVLNAAHEIADALQRDNSRFNPEHFLAVVRGEKDLHSKPGSKKATCIKDGCGKTFDTSKSEKRDAATLKPFWSKYCPRHRVMSAQEAMQIFREEDR